MTAVLLAVLVTALPGIDHAIYEDIHHGWQAPGLTFVMNVVTEAGGPVAQTGLAGALYLRGSVSQQRAARLAGIAWFSGMAATAGLKAAVRRPRPERVTVEWWDSSFPSSHVASYCALTTVYGRKWPELAPFLGLGAFAVCLSRVYLGEHYPSDVLAGAALGFGSASLVLMLENRLTPALDRLLPVGRVAFEGEPGRLGLVCGI